MQLSNEEIATIAITLAIFIIYHIIYYLNILRTQNNRLNPNVQNAYYWVSKHFTKADAPSTVLALHVVRNTILISIFIGGNSFTIAYNYLNAFPGTQVDSVMGVRNIIISTFLFCSFLNFASVIRSSSHLGYLLGSSSDDITDELVGETYQEQMGNLANNIVFHFNIGFRFIFMSIPFALLSAGVTTLLISSVIMIVFLFELDYYSFVKFNSKLPMPIEQSPDGMNI
jgi:hypothetical protein